MQERKGNMKTLRWLGSIVVTVATFSHAPFALAQNAAVVMTCAPVADPFTSNAGTFVVNRYDRSPSAPDIAPVITPCATALEQLFDAGLVLVSVREAGNGPAYTLVRPRTNFAGTP